jgi:hypothetical protein
MGQERGFPRKTKTGSISELVSNLFKSLGGFDQHTSLLVMDQPKTLEINSDQRNSQELRKEERDRARTEKPRTQKQFTDQRPEGTWRLRPPFPTQKIQFYTTINCAVDLSQQPEHWGRRN